MLGDCDVEYEASPRRVLSSPQFLWLETFVLDGQTYIVYNLYSYCIGLIGNHKSIHTIKGYLRQDI